MHIKKQGHLNERAALFFGAQIIKGLDFLHSQGILYNDLKPENVLIDVQGDIKLAGFGISHKLQGDTERVHKVIGTAQYMPPEAYVKDKGYNWKFDMWSLGCCLYEIVVGSPPFGANPNDQAVMKNEIISNEVKMKDYFSKDFVNLLDGLLDKNENTRLCI